MSNLLNKRELLKYKGIMRCYFTMVEENLVLCRLLCCYATCNSYVTPLNGGGGGSSLLFARGSTGREGKYFIYFKRE